MLFKATIENGEIVIENKTRYKDFLKRHEGKKIDVDLVMRKSKRSDQQNAALHLWFTMLADELNSAGYDMKKVMRKSMDIPWTAYNVKEFLWRPTQEAQLGKKSTTQLSTDEIDKVYDVINKAIGERTGVHVSFPSMENLYQQ